MILLYLSSYIYVVLCVQDQTDYAKADPAAYLQIADKLDSAGFDYIAIEDAHRHNSLELFKRFKKSQVTTTLVIMTLINPVI